MGRSDRKRRGCFVYLGATLLVVSTLLPITRYSWFMGGLPMVGSFFDLSKDPPRYGADDPPDLSAHYLAALGDTCLPGQGMGEFYGILGLAVAAVGAFHLRLSRLLRIPFSGAVVWIAYTFWRFVSCMNTVEPPMLFTAGFEYGPDDVLVTPWGWVAALAGTIILGLESFVPERRPGKTPEQLRRVFK